MNGPLTSILLAIFTFSSGPSLGADPAPTPAVDGELHVTLKNAEYVKVQVNGEDYDNIEFEHSGKVVLIKGLSLSLERNSIVLLPHDAALKQAELEVLPKEFKKQRKGREVFLVAKKSIAFEKVPTDPQPTPDKPKEDPVAPPPPQKDDL